MDAAQPLLRLQVLGGFRAYRGADRIPDTGWERPRARTLVKLLAIQAGHHLHQEQILEALWPDLAPESASSALRKALTYARQALEPGLPARAASHYLVVTGGLVSLDPAMVEVDATLFERAAAAALDAPGDLHALENAVHLYTGEVLPEERYEEWVIGRREQLAALHLRVLQRLAQVLEHGGRYAEAIDRLQEVLLLDPLHEPAHRSLMHLYALSGSRHQALRQFQLCRQVLMEGLGVEPEAETSELYRSLARAETRAPAGSAPASHDEVAYLPAAVTRRLTGALMGRERPLQVALDDVQQSIDSTTPLPNRRSVLLISGEAGVGKSRLAAEIARRAHQQGALVLWGSGREHEGCLPYGPFVELLNEHISRQPKGERHRLADMYGELRRLLPALSGVAPLPPEPVAGSPGDMALARLFAAFAGLLSDLAGDRSAVVILDDLHTVDPLTLQLLHYLARQVPARPWLLLGSYREEEVEPAGALHELLGALASEGLSRQIDLLRLSRADTDALVAGHLEGTVPDDVLARIYALSLGNPLFTLEMLQAMRERGELRLHHDVWTMPVHEPSVPDRVADLVMLRIHALPDEAQRVLTLAAVSGMEPTFALLRVTAQQSFEPPLSDARLLDALDAGLGAHLIEEREDGYAFRHPLIRSTLYERTSRHRRSYLHAVLAATLERQRPDEPEPLAYHYSAAGDQEKAAIFREHAGDRAAGMYANDMAASHYRDAAETLRRVQQPDAVARVLHKLGNVLSTMSRFDEALAVLEEVVSIRAALDDPDGAGRALAAIGRVYRWQGKPDLGLARVEEGLQTVARDGSAPDTRLALTAVYSALLFAQGRFGESLEQAERGAVLAGEIGNDVLLAELDGRRGTILSMMGNIAEGREIIQSALALAQRVGNSETACTLFQSLAAGFHAEGRFHEARQSIEQCLAIAEHRSNPVQVGNALTFLGNLLLHLGEVAEGGRHLSRAVDVFEAVGPSWPLAYAVASLGCYSLFKGEWDRAEKQLARGVDMAEACGHAQVARYAGIMLAEEDLMLGRFNSALDRLNQLSIPESAHASTVLALTGWARLGLDDPTGALQSVEGAICGAEAEGNRENLITATWVQGMVLTRAERWGEAEAAFDRTLHLAHEMSYPFMEGRARLERGRMYQARGDVARAREEFRRARDLFKKLGATAYVQWVEEALSAPSPA